MKSQRRSILEMLDDTVRWTGMPGRVAKQISGEADGEFRPARWAPIGAIAFSCALLMISLGWSPTLEAFGWALIIAFVMPISGGIIAVMSAIHAKGPLGSSSLDDDERESALRKDSFLFTLLLLAVLNVLGQPCLMILSKWQDWQFAQTAIVVTSAFMLNVTLLVSLPTLYASWKLPQLPNE